MEKPKLAPGVVFGQDYIDLINWAKASKYALPAVNVTSTSTLNAALEAAANAKSDIIIQLSAGGAQFYAGKGIKDTLAAQTKGAISAARHVHEVAAEYGVCVILHTDHANRGLLPWIDSLISASEAEVEKSGRPLFSSHMIDLSEEPVDENLAACEERLKRLSAIGMSLEIELGITGGEEDGVGVELEDVDESKLYTTPEDIFQAYELLSPIGHFTVAAAFGNVHGVYAPGNVRLTPQILKNGQEFVFDKIGGEEKPISYVFHGGSGSSQKDFDAAISYGVIKVNIDTDTQFAYSKPAGAYVESNGVAFKHQIDPITGDPQKKKYDPRAWMRQCEVSMAARLGEAFEAFNAVGKSVSH